MTTHRESPCRLRSATPEDADGIQAVYAPIVRDTTISFEYEVPTVDEMRRRIVERVAKFPWIVAEKDGEILGYATAGTFRSRTAYDWSAESSIYLSPRGMGQGIARRLYAALHEILRLQGVRVVIAGIALPNDRSVRFHESFGYRPIAIMERIGFKFGTWCDLGFWRFDLDASDSPPRPLVAFPGLAGESADVFVRW